MVFCRKVNVKRWTMSTSSHRNPSVISYLPSHTEEEEEEEEEKEHRFVRLCRRNHTTLTMPQPVHCIRHSHRTSILMDSIVYIKERGWEKEMEIFKPRETKKKVEEEADVLGSTRMKVMSSSRKIVSMRRRRRRDSMRRRC